MKNWQAFTLAEVLITLGIIGIVAAMTMPTLINNSRNKQLETGLKRSYSIIGQALEMYQAKNGERIKAGEVGGWKLKKELMPYFKIARDCGYGAGSEGAASVEKACIKHYTSGDNGQDSNTYRSFNGKNQIDLQLFDDGQFVLIDGSLILLENNTDRIHISVDVNGYNKRPNRLGQDLFMFDVDKDGRLIPMGADNSRFYDENDKYCSLTESNSLNGAGCTYKALTDKFYFSNLPK